jgi:23S rRNA pseudouridine2605 synthase
VQASGAGGGENKSFTLPARKGARASKTQERVRTAPARIRQVREADNPWYEVTLIEGKNRQLRKMFEEIGHHVEKIKRVRYGPLGLDVPPGEFRRLSLGEVGKLKRAAGIDG